MDSKEDKGKEKKEDRKMNGKWEAEGEGERRRLEIIRKLEMVKIPLHFLVQNGRAR